MNIVEAVSKSDSDLVYNLLIKRYPSIYADIWKVGLNMALRITDLLAIKFEDLDLTAKQLCIVEGKTGKNRIIRLNAPAIEIIKKRRINNPSHIYLFQVESNRAKNKAISRVSVSRVLKEAGEILGLTIGTHSMRKSRGKAMFDAGVPVEKIAKVLNHSSSGVTLRYIGIEHRDVMQTYTDFEL
jgi:integrase